VGRWSIANRRLRPTSDCTSQRVGSGACLNLRSANRSELLRQLPTAAPPVFGLLAPEGLAKAPRIDAGFAAIVAAGLLVGVGTRYGSGCTSGHGVCGLSRLSRRSSVATVAFMGAGCAMVFAVRHVQ
jgi:hypothetical protein